MRKRKEQKQKSVWTDAAGLAVRMILFERCTGTGNILQMDREDSEFEQPLVGWLVVKGAPAVGTNGRRCRRLRPTLFDFFSHAMLDTCRGHFVCFSRNPKITRYYRFVFCSSYMLAVSVFFRACYSPISTLMASPLYCSLTFGTRGCVKRRDELPYTRSGSRCFLRLQQMAV